MELNNDQPSVEKPVIKSSIRFPVVGIGASAGGLEAFKKFVSSIPETSGMAYVFVQHLAASHLSVLPELLQKTTPIPIHEITDNIRLEPDHIFIIPSTRLRVANDGILELSPRPAGDQKSMTIDYFFSSLAEVHDTHAIGVVLSGTGTDGAKRPRTTYPPGDPATVSGS
jgi:two-component system CheB/CheR fusion protein